MLNNVLFILLGAGLVTVGFLAAALAERIRASGMETSGRPETRGQEKRTPRPPSISIDRESSLAYLGGGADAPAEMPRTPTVTRTPRAARQAAPSPGDDVIAALVAAGYKRPVAAEATWACDTAERTTIEHWTAAALRRCARGLS